MKFPLYPICNGCPPGQLNTMLEKASLTRFRHMTAKRSSMLSGVQIASPCPASWNAMEGSDKVRFCGQCKLNVYNLSAMSQSEAEKLIIEKEGRLCVRFFRRKDGTVITQDCPVGLRWLKKRIRSVQIIAASLCHGCYRSCAAKHRSCLNKTLQFELPAQAVATVQSC